MVPPPVHGFRGQHPRSFGTFLSETERRTICPLSILGIWHQPPMVTDESSEQELTEAKGHLTAVAESESLKGLHVRTEVQLSLAREQVLGMGESQAVGLIVLPHEYLRGQTA
jgi:hypothetical protein